MVLTLILLLGISSVITGAQGSVGVKMARFSPLLAALYRFSYGFFSPELRNGTACKEEILQLVCAEDEVLAIHSAVFDGHDTNGCGILMPINISTLLTPDMKEELEHNARRFSVQSSINRRYIIELLYLSTGLLSLN